MRLQPSLLQDSTKFHSQVLDVRQMTPPLMSNSSSSSSANYTAVDHELFPRLPVFYHALDLFWRWWVYLADYAGNVLMKHQLWETGLTFAMFRVEKGAPVDQFILWIPDDKP